MKKVIIPGLSAGVLMFIVGMVLSQVFNTIFPSLNEEYSNSALIRQWSDPIMTLYFLYPFVLGIVLAWAWENVKKNFNGKTVFDRGSRLSFFYWLIASIPGMFITYSSFQVSLLIVIAWSLVGLVEAIAAGMVLAKLNS